MSADVLSEKLAGLQATRPVVVVGAAVIDVIADAYALPWRGCDIELHQQGVNIGGCALNIAVALKRLGVDACNALPLGKGMWSDIIRASMAKEGLTSVVEAEDGDNGWCLALVEPDGERTFMSFSGVENQWRAEWLAGIPVPPGALVYLSGYQLASASGERLVNWLEGLKDITAFIDFGPRIVDIPAPLLERIMACKPLVSLNRQETEFAAEILSCDDDVTTFGKSWVARFQAPLVVRQDKAGAWYFTPDEHGLVAPFPATVLDSIGAGDSHAGGTLAGLAAGWSLPDAVMLGNAVAAWVVSHRGGDCAPTRAELLLAHKHV